MYRDIEDAARELRVSISRLCRWAGVPVNRWYRVQLDSQELNRLMREIERERERRAEKVTG